MNIRRVIALIPAQNIDASVRFYRDKLGLRLESETEDCAIFEEGVGVVMASEPIDPDDLRLNAVIVTLFVDDTRAAYAELISRGVPFLIAPTEDDGANVAALRDPDGNVIQLMQGTLGGR